MSFVINTEASITLQAPLTRVTACHVSTYYHVGFCYIALRRYPDAIRTFVSILNFILRMRQYHTRSYQYDQVSRLFRFSADSSLTRNLCFRSIKLLTGCMLSLLFAMRCRRVGWMTISQTLLRRDMESKFKK